MTDNLITCKHCSSDACYVQENSPTIKTYSCFGCGYTTNTLMKEGQWFSPDHGQVGHYLKDMFENYKDYIDGGKRQGFYSKTNFSFEKMTEKMAEHLKRIPEFPKQVALKLPQLKKIELPKLTKI